MNIFTTLDDHYYPRLRVFARTLRKHTKSDISLTILHFSLSDKKIAAFKKISKKLSIRTSFVKVDEEKFRDFKLIHQITSEAYTKLLVLEIFPDADRALWIDVDTIVMKDLEEYYRTDLEDYYVMGTPENKEKLDIKRLELNADGCYFNAGVILFNLKKIRAGFTTDDFYQAYRTNEARIRFADQDVVNIAFSSRVKRDDEKKYNYMVRSGYQMSDEEKRWIEENVYIMHFIRHIKPWHYCYQGRARYFYLKEMFPVYPFRTVLLLIGGELYQFKKNKKTLENSDK